MAVCWWIGALDREDDWVALVGVMKRRGERRGRRGGGAQQDQNVFWTDSFVTLCHRGTSRQPVCAYTVGRACVRESVWVWQYMWQRVMSVNYRTDCSLENKYCLKGNMYKVNLCVCVRVLELPFKRICMCCGIQSIWPQSVSLHYL